MVKVNKIGRKVNQLTPIEKYWNQVDQQTHYLIADLLNKTLPLPNLRDKKNLDLAQDADYRTLLFETETNYSQADNLPTTEVLTEEMAYEYLLLVVKSLLSNLSDFNCHLDFENLTNY